MSDAEAIRDNIKYLLELRAELKAKKRPRNKDGKEVPAKIVRAVVERGCEAVERGYRFLLDGNDDATQVREEILRAIVDHGHNLPKAANAPSHFAIKESDVWVMDQLKEADGRKRIGYLVRAGKGKGSFDRAISDEAHIDRIERNRRTYAHLKWPREQE
jgi:hypothetical protein